MIARNGALPDVQNFKYEVVFFAQARVLHPLLFRCGSLSAPQRIRCKTGAESTSNEDVINRDVFEHFPVAIPILPPAGLSFRIPRYPTKASVMNAATAYRARDSRVQ